MAINENQYQQGLTKAIDNQMQEEAFYAAALAAGDLPLDTMRGEEPDRFFSEVDSY